MVYIHASLCTECSALAFFQYSVHPFRTRSEIYPFSCSCLVCMGGDSSSCLPDGNIILCPDVVAGRVSTEFGVLQEVLAGAGASDLENVPG